MATANVVTYIPSTTNIPKKTEGSTMAITMYKAAKIVNAELANRGVAKVLPPQMLYTYAKKGYFATIKVEDKVRVEEVELAKWFETYFNKLTGVKQEEVEMVACEMQDDVDPNQLTIEDIQIDDES